MNIHQNLWRNQLDAFSISIVISWRRSCVYQSIRFYVGIYALVFPGALINARCPSFILFKTFQEKIYVIKKYFHSHMLQWNSGQESLMLFSCINLYYQYIKLQIINIFNKNIIVILISLKYFIRSQILYVFFQRKWDFFFFKENIIFNTIN